MADPEPGFHVPLDTSLGGWNQPLPKAKQGYVMKFTNVATSGNNAVTLVPSGLDTILPVASPKTVAPGESIELACVVDGIWVQSGVHNGAYVPTLGPSNGTDDTSAINTALATGGPVRGQPRQNYIFSTLIFKSGTRLDVSGCTLTQKAGATGYMTQNYSWANPVATASDGATTSGSNVVNTALGAQAVAGQLLTVAGAGSNGNGPLVAVVASATATTVTLNTLDGRAANATAAVSAAAVTLQNVDADIQIKGGTWARGGNNTVLASIAFTGVTGLDIDIDRYTSTNVTRGVQVGACTNYSVNIRDASSEGVVCFLAGPLYKGKVPLVRGTCDDDGLTVQCSDYPGANHANTAGDIIGLDIGTVDIDSVAGVHETGANLFKVIAGAGWLADKIKVHGGIYGTCALYGVWIGDDTGQAATTGGTYGHIDCGLVAATPQTTGRLMQMIAPSATSIKARLRMNQTTAVLSGEPVLLSGASTSTIGLLELDIDADCASQASFANFVTVGAANTDVKQLTLRGRVTLPSTGAPTTFTITSGTVETLTLDDFQTVGGSQVGYPVFQTGGTLGKVIARGGTTTSTNCFYRNSGGTSAPTLVLDGNTLSGLGRVAQNNAAGITLNAVLNQPVITGMTNTAFFVSGGNVTVTGAIAPGFTAQIIQRAASETCRVNGARLPVDVSLLTPSAGDMALNTNSSAVYGGANCVVTYDGTSWRAARGYLKTGTATLAAGTVTVADTAITANSVIRLATRTPGGTQGSPYISALTAGTGFTITSTSNTDTSVIEYEVVRY